MGTDIQVTSPDGNAIEHYHFSKNRAIALIQYGLWVGDYNDKTVRDLLPVLNAVIFKMLEAGIKPLIEFRDWCRNEEAAGALGNAIHFRNGLEANCGLDWKFWMDS